MPGYLNVAGFRKRTIMSDKEVDYLEERYPGWLQQTLDDESAELNSRLIKRYAVPFDVADPPLIVVRWITKIVTLAAYMKRGFNPSSEQDQLVAKHEAEAKTDIKEAADSKDGLFELPLRQAAEGTSAVTRGGPLSYSEQSPYVFADDQAAIGREEDARGR